MEVWILLAAAGSGYLARRWQNLQKPKGSPEEEAYDRRRVSTSCEGPSHRNRYRHFSSTVKRKGGKVLCGKDPQWTVTHGTDQKKESRLNDNKKVDRQVETLDHDISVSEKYLGKDSVNAIEAPSSGSILELDHLELDEGKKTYDVKDLRHRISKMQLGGTGEMTDLDNDEYNASAEKPSPVLFGSLSVKRTNDNDNEKMTRSRYTDQDGYAGKRMKDTSSSPNVQQEDSIFGKMWMPGFWDVSKGVFVLDTESLLVQDEFETRTKGNSSSRKSRTPNKYGKRRPLRKKNLETAKPMSSLESCLSAQLDEYSRRNKKREQLQTDFFRRSEMETSGKNLEVTLSEEKVGFPSADSVIGLPSLASGPSSVRKPFGSSRTLGNSNWNIMQRKSTAGKSFPPQSWNKSNTYIRESSFGGLVFNFGVGVGMMFTLLSNMEKARRLGLILETTESLIKDLDDDLKNPDAGEKLSVEEQSFPSSPLIKFRNISESLHTIRRLLSSEAEPVIFAQPNDLSKLEAELEAELERMELWDTGDVSKTERGNSRSSELDGSIGSLVQGELTISGLPHEFKADSEAEDGSNSSNEDLHARSFAVSPRELARRLHEVLETQQEERISELETEVKHLIRKLHTKEKEIQWLKEGSLNTLTDNNESLSFIDGKPYDSAHNCYFKRSDVESVSSKDQFVPNFTVPSSLPHSSNDDFQSSPFLSNDMESKKSTAYITLQGDALAAYMDACSEFSEVANEQARTHLTRHEGTETFKDQLKFAADATECDLDAIYLSNSEGMEQVDLVSLAEDLYVNGDPQFMGNIPAIPVSARRSRKRNSRKNSAIKHPQPEHLISTSRGFDSSDDTANDTSGSTPCSVKFMDVLTPCFQNQSMSSASDEFGSTRNPPHQGDVLIQSGVHTPKQTQSHRVYSELEGRHYDLASESKESGWKTVDEQDYYSDLDEQLGKLLIKKIVEKSKKGSPIIQDAQSILASFESNDNISDYANPL